MMDFHPASPAFVKILHFAMTVSIQIINRKIAYAAIAVIIPPTIALIIFESDI